MIQTISFFWLPSLLLAWRCAQCKAATINQTSASAEVSQRNRHSTFPMFHGRLCWWIAHYAAIPNPTPLCLSFFLTLSTPLSAHTHTNNLLPLTLPPTLPLSSRPLGLWSSGVRWVGGLVGGSWGWRAERAGIQSNMHREITIAPLGDLQMLAAQGIVVGSYHRSNTSWETAKQHIQPTDLLSLS